MSSWNTNVLPFEPVYYCQPSARHVVQPPSGYGHPTRDIVTSVCDVMSTFLKHPLSEVIIKPKSPSVVELLPKVLENEKLMEHLQGVFNAVRVAYEKPNDADVAPNPSASHDDKSDVDVRKATCGVNLESYPHRLLLTFQCDWAADGVAILHIDPVKPAVLTLTVHKPHVRIIDIEKVVCCDMDVYTSHRTAKQRCFVFLDQVNEVDLVDHLEIHLTLLHEAVTKSYILQCKSST